jgi:hypothetical protein
MRSTPVTAQEGTVHRLAMRMIVILGSFIAALAAGATENECVMISGTADGFAKQMAVEASRSSLEDAITQWESKNGVAAVDVEAAKPVPRPYWRRSVRPFLVLTPDEISERAYTICWQGVISPVVCTSGAEVCW